MSNVKKTEEIDLLALEIDMQSKEIDLPPKEILLPPKEIALRPKEIALPPKEIDLQPKEIDLPAKEIILPAKEIFLQHKEIGVGCHRILFLSKEKVFLPLNYTPKSPHLQPPPKIQIQNPLDRLLLPLHIQCIPSKHPPQNSSIN